MAIKKSALYSSLWKSCDELRDGMDASQYKDYVLVLLFVKYVSDKYASKANAAIDVPPGGSFKDMIALKGQKDIGDAINKIISKLAEANDLKGVIDVADFNNSDKLGRGKEMQDRLTKLIGIFENPALNFSKNGADGDDLLGDAYEYLMRHFATESGKSKGQFYTPAEVSRIMAKLIGVANAKSQDQTIYDPTCGSGSLLLKAAHEAPRGITIYGQELDNATRTLAKMNMILHGHPTADIWQGNSLSLPHWKDQNGNLKQFDFVVANPPFSTKSWSNGFDPFHDEYERFVDGVPPIKNGDYAFMLHIIRSLKSTGKGAVILPHGVLFRGNVEGQIRKNVIKKGYIKGIISLPANLFYGTGIPACIIVIDKEDAANHKSLFMIDASKGFIKDGNKNRLRDQDIHRIVDVFTRQIDIPKYARMVSQEEIQKNDYNLNIPRYIDSSEEEDIQDIEAHLLGGIPNRDIDNLEGYWRVYPSLKSELFSPSDRSGYSQIKVDPTKIKSTIYSHPEFIAYAKKIDRVFNDWQSREVATLKKIAIGTHPPTLIETLSDGLLQAFSNVQLIDKYDVYQHLMTYWSDSMQDDVHMIVTDGWQANNELIPNDIFIQQYFSLEQKLIEKLESDKESIARQKEELEEEHGGEEGMLEELKSDKGKISKGSVQARIKVLKHEQDSNEDLKVLNEYLSLINQESEVNKKIKDVTIALERKIIVKHKALSQDEVKNSVVEVKWMNAIYNTIRTEMNRISQALTQRIKELVERYDRPMPELQAVQQLLTGKKRLPGFSEQWEVKKLGDLTFVTSGGTPNTFINAYWGGEIKWMNSGELNLKKIYDVEGRITEIGLKNSSTKLIPQNCILVSLAGQGKTRGTVAINYIELCTNQSIAAVFPSKIFVSEYLYYDLDFRYEELRALSTGEGGRGGLNLRILNSLEIRLPPFSEQQAIAKIFSDMDAEIERLEQQRNKAKLIKQGMMQELLTGKTRLI